MRTVWQTGNLWNVAFIIGLAAFIFGAAFSLYQFFNRKMCTERAEGAITTGTQFGMPYPKLTYTVNGVEYSKPFSGSETTAGMRNVTVVYNPSNPGKFYILEDKSNNLILGIAFLIGGVVFMLVGFGAYIGLFPEHRR